MRIEQCQGSIKQLIGIDRSESVQVHLCLTSHCQAHPPTIILVLIETLRRAVRFQSPVESCLHPVNFTEQIITVGIMTHFFGGNLLQPEAYALFQTRLQQPVPDIVQDLADTGKIAG